MSEQQRPKPTRDSILRWSIVNGGVSFLTLISFIGFARTYSLWFFVPVFILALAYPVLILTMILSPILLWKHHRFQAFVPLGVLLGFTSLLVVTIGWGREFFMFGTPAVPKSYLTEERRRELESAADSLLGNGFKQVVTFPPKSFTVEMVAGEPLRVLPAGIVDSLRRNRIHRTWVDDEQSIVVFGHYGVRTWYRYIRSEKELIPLYSRPVEITRVDVEMWSEIIDIARQGPSATASEKQELAFNPSIAHPYLVAVLGNEVVARIGGYPSERDITDEDKGLILDALNTQRLVSSKLVEHPEIWFEEDAYIAPLHVATGSITDGFWVTQLIEKLLNEGTLLYSEDGRHLRIKQTLSPDEERAIEWVHVGLINFIYGNLISKDEIAYQESLGNGWYFNVD